MPSYRPRLMRTNDRPAVVLYDWAHPAQQHFAQITKLLRQRADLSTRFREYHSRLHMELVLQRRAIQTEIKEALNLNCTPYPFSRWQRTIRWKYSNHPLCTKGSLTRGGRFNIGSNIDPAVFPPFSAFYASADKDTALQEALGQGLDHPGIDPRELALANPDSVLAFSVSGSLDSVLDLRDRACVGDFVKLIRDFKLSPALKREAARLPVVAPDVVRTSKALLDSLLNPNWRHVPTLCEIPSNSQIFGQIVWQAGIEGIVYPSKQTNEACLAVFPSNFIGGSSFLQCDDEPPEPLLGPSRIDATNCEACERTAVELKASPLRNAEKT